MTQTCDKVHKEILDVIQTTNHTIFIKLLCVIKMTKSINIYEKQGKIQNMN